MLKNYYSSNLNQYEYDAYNTISSSIMNNQEECVLFNIDTETSKKVVNAVLLELPEVFHCMLQFVAYQQVRNGTRIRFYYIDLDPNKFDNEINNILNELDKKITPYSSDYEITKIVYDYLASTVKADLDAYNKYLQITDLNNYNQVDNFLRNNGSSFSAYGPLVNKRGACMGLALAFKLLLEKYSVESCVLAVSKNDIPHAINVVEIDGKMAYVDITEGLIVEGLDFVLYNYFLVSERIIKKICVFESDLTCDDETLSYFYKNKLIFKDLKHLRKYLEGYKHSSTKGQIRFFYDSNAIDNQYLNKVTNNILQAHVGRDFQLHSKLVKDNFGNCLMKRKER